MFGVFGENSVLFRGQFANFQTKLTISNYVVNLV